MKDELLRHKIAYLILILGITVFVFMFLGAWPNRWQQRLVVLGISSFYFFWGLLTHFKTQTITKNVAWEYGMVAVMAGVLLLLITL